MMDFVALMEQAGLKVVNGHLRLSAALEAGIKVSACDDKGAAFQIYVQGSQLVVEEVTGQAPAAPMLMVKRVEISPVQNQPQDRDAVHWIRPSQLVSQGVKAEATASAEQSSHAEGLLSDPHNWQKIDIPDTLGSGSALWAIRQCDLLRLLSVKIGASYVSVRDGAKRTGLAVRPVSSLPTAESPDDWTVEFTPESTSFFYTPWAIREADLIQLLAYGMSKEVTSIAEASKASGMLMRPVNPIS